MKDWMKLILGIAVGAALGWMLPTDAGILDLFAWISRMVIGAGRYLLFPLLFCGLTIGTYELHLEKGIFKVYWRIFLYILASTALLVFIGTGSVLIFVPERIPVVIEERLLSPMPGYRELLELIFPDDFFSIFSANGDFLIPIAAAAFLLGTSLKFDQVMSRPAAQFFDSMNRILYRLNGVFLRILSLGMVLITAQVVLMIRSSVDLALFSQILGIVVIDVVIVLFGVFPFIYYLLSGRKNPYRVLYDILAPALAALLSGNTFFTLPFLFRYMKENSGVPRKVATAGLPLFAAFGRAGTAMVSSVMFISLISFYSGLGITAAQVLWVLLFTFLVSFCLPAVPGAGVFVSLSLLCRYYGRGLEEGYLLLSSIAPLLAGLGVLVDTAAAAFSVALIARKTEMVQTVEVAETI